MSTNFKDLIKKEYQKCAVDPVYFMKKYCYIQHPIKGRLLFNLYDYQEDALTTFEDKKYTIVLKGRQIGLSTVVACYALWMMIFHKDKNVLVIATKQDTAKNLITKVRFAFDNLPPWLQVPCVENNKLSLRFKNGSQIKASSSSGDAGRSEAVSLLVFDEAAFIKNIEDIWASAQATLSTGGKAILISTPNGIGNFFYKKYTEGEEFKDRPRDGVFYPVKLDWRVHPDRDQKWRDEQENILGPQKARQEFDAEFLGSGNTVIDGDVIEFHHVTNVREPEMKRGPGGDIWVWETVNYRKSYIVVADVARGENSETGDYSAVHVIDAETCAQVAEYRGRINTTEYGHMLVALATEYNDALLVIENSNIGWATIQTAIDRGYKNLFYMTEDLKYLDPNEMPSNKLYRQQKNAVAGFTTSTRTRPLIISKLDEYMRNNAVIIRSQRTIDEMMTFVWENGKAQASDGYHDDLIMSLSIGLWVRDTALQIHSTNMQYTRMALDKITKVSGVDAVYTPDRGASNPGVTLNRHTRPTTGELPPMLGGADPYHMPILGGPNQNEDLRWLL